MSTSAKLEGLRIDRSDEERASPPRRGLILLAVLLLVVAALFGWWLTRDRATMVRTERVLAQRDAARPAVLDASGYVVARRRATISSKVTGKVVEVRVEEGTAVSEGQVLARLDDAAARQALALSEARLAASRSALEEDRVRRAEAELTLERSRALVAASVASEADLDRAEAEVDVLEARLRQRQDEVAVAERQIAVDHQVLDDTVIRAPFAGVVISKDAQPGEMISPVSAGGGFTRTGICTVVDMTSLEIEVDVNESYINRVRAGQRVEAILDAYPDWRIPGSVITTVPTADRQRATVRVRIAFDTLDDRVLPDMGVKVAFLSDEAPASTVAPEAAIRIAEAAVRRGGGEDAVLVVVEGRVERRVVVLGPRRSGRVAILEGLEGGERVVVEGPDDLAAGDEVREREER